MFYLEEGAQLNPNAPSEYHIQGHERLHDIIQLFVLNPTDVHLSWEEGAPQLKKGDVMSLITQSDKLALQVKRGRTVKLSPQARITKHVTKPDIIPLEHVQQFLIHPRLITDEEMETSGEILDNASGKLLSYAGDRIYVTGLLDSGTENDDYFIFRIGQAYRNQDSDDVIAYEAIHLGDARLVKQDEISTLEILSVRREILKRDRVLAIEKREFGKDFYPRIPNIDILEDARIIAVVDGVSQIGQYQVVVVNQGLNDGIERGHLLQVNKGGRLIPDPKDSENILKLPSEKSGSLMVFKAFDDISYALVMKALAPLHIYDEVTIP